MPQYVLEHFFLLRLHSGSDDHENKLDESFRNCFVYIFLFVAHCEFSMHRIKFYYLEIILKSANNKLSLSE
eukprot:m.12267 g.12267  ORF g.12267 m.12267 type:complete len:71 (+) comp4624_c0_seq1:1081-1293(+)